MLIMVQVFNHQTGLFSQVSRKKLITALENTKLYELKKIDDGVSSDYDDVCLSGTFELLHDLLDTDTSSDRFTLKRISKHLQPASEEDGTPALLIEQVVVYCSFDETQADENKLLIKSVLGKMNSISVGTELLNVHGTIHFAIPMKIVHQTKATDVDEALLQELSVTEEETAYWLVFEPAIGISPDGKVYIPCPLHELILHKILQSYDTIYQKNTEEQLKRLDTHFDAVGMKIYAEMSDAEIAYINREKALLIDESMKDRAAAAGFHIIIGILEEYQIPFNSSLKQELSVADEAIKKSSEHKLPITILFDN